MDGRHVCLDAVQSFLDLESGSDRCTVVELPAPEPKVMSRTTLMRRGDRIDHTGTTAGVAS